MGLQADLGEVEGVLEDLRDHACGLHVDQYRVGADTEDHARCQRQYPSLPEQHLTGEQEARLWGEGTPWFVGWQGKWVVVARGPARAASSGVDGASARQIAAFARDRAPNDARKVSGADVGQVCESQVVRGLYAWYEGAERVLQLHLEERGVGLVGIKGSGSASQEQQWRAMISTGGYLI